MPATTVCPAPARRAQGSTTPFNGKVVDVVARAQSGDSEAFAQLYNRYVDEVHRFVQRRVGSREIAEDLTSEVFLRALRRIRQFTWRGTDLRAWLVTIARNVVTDHHRSSRCRRETLVAEIGRVDADQSPESNPEQLVGDHLRNLALLQAVEQLSRPQQRCIALRFLADLSVAETAEAMDKSESAIKSLQLRALRALSTTLPASAVIA